MSKKCVFIIPYFGKFNNYFPLFLKSCEKNNLFNWIIFTDNETKYDYPKNVKVVKMTLNKMKEIAEKKLGFQVCMETPYKLCDYKPSYGFLFEEYIKEYDYWGHCDCDLIFGNLNKLLMPLLNQEYDKLFAAGHLSIYKNNYNNNRIFMKKYNERYIYKEAFTTNSIYVLDEDCKCTLNTDSNNIHSIFLNEDMKVYSEDLSMNASTTSAVLVREYYNSEMRNFTKESYHPKRYYWCDGNVFSLEWNEKIKDIISKQYIYIHLQMRKMRMKDSIKECELVGILPDRFIKIKRVPKNKKELRMWTINCPYFYWIDIYCRKIQKKLR